MILELYNFIPPTTEKMAVRREIRLRKEFLLKKQKESQDVAIVEKKRKLKTAIDNEEVIPTELVSEARKLHHEIELDLPSTEGSIDDEYANVGIYEPKVCVTTSRDPSSRLKQFAKFVALRFLYFPTEIGGRHAVGFVADDQVPI